MRTFNLKKLLFPFDLPNFWSKMSIGFIARKQIFFFLGNHCFAKNRKLKFLSVLAENVFTSVNFDTLIHKFYFWRQLTVFTVWIFSFWMFWVTQRFFKSQDVWIEMSLTCSSSTKRRSQILTTTMTTSLRIRRKNLASG